jgi:electron transport complex protein RnfE
MLLKAFIPALSDALGVFIPLIVVNCIIIGRAESFAMKNSLAASALDGVFQGLGYTLVLVAMCVIRELLGQGTFGAGLLDISTGALKVTLDGTGGGIQIFPGEFAALSMILPFGGFITLGVLIALTQYCMRKVEEKKAKKGETK